MLVYFKYIFGVVLFIISDIVGALNVSTEENPSLNKRSTGELRSDGIFVTFLKNLLDLLTTSFPEKKLSKFCRTLYRHMLDLEFKYTRRLAKHFKYLGRMYREDLRSELKAYRDRLDGNLPHQTAFLHAMNDIFTRRENLLFHDYVYDVRNFGTEDIISIEDETRKLLNDVIVGRILKLSVKEQDVLYQKLRKAYKEYNE